MDVIGINTGLENFLGVDQITEIRTDAIKGSRKFSNAPFYLCLEALAQVCALHVRHITDFEKHAFLLKVTRCPIHVDQVFSGQYILRSKLLSHSRHAFSYSAKAIIDGKTGMGGEFIIATMDYGKDFKEEIIKTHYKKVFSCLQKGTQTN